MKNFDYSIKDITDALKKVGLEKGNNIFTHANIGFFGKLKNAQKPKDYYLAFKKAVFKVIGQGGTWIIPTFSYSFCNDQVFDYNKTPGVGGLLDQMVLKDPEAIRSKDANFSIAALGTNKFFFTKNPPKFSFGKNSFWDRFLTMKGKICNFNFDVGSTFIHYVERVNQVPYRYYKAFPGISVENGKKIKKVFYHFVYDLKKPDNGPEFTKFDKKAREVGMIKTANLGKGQIVLITALDTFNLITQELKSNPAFLIKSRRIDI